MDNVSRVQISILIRVFYTILQNEHVAQLIIRGSTVGNTAMVQSGSSFLHSEIISVTELCVVPYRSTPEQDLTEWDWWLGKLLVQMLADMLHDHVNPSCMYHCVYVSEWHEYLM